MKYLKIGIILIITAFSFSAFSVLPAEAVVPKDKDIKAESGQGCKLFGITASDSCAGGLICQREAIPPGDPEENNCATDVGNPTGSACEGICRVPGSAEAKFGLGTKSKFTGTGLGQSSDLKGTIANIINIVLGFLGIVAVLFILIGGFKVMTAAGNEENTESGKKAVTGGVIGLVIVFAAWAIASFVIGNLLGATEKAA